MHTILYIATPCVPSPPKKDSDCTVHSARGYPMQLVAGNSPSNYSRLSFSFFLGNLPISVFFVISSFRRLFEDSLFPGLLPFRHCPARSFFSLTVVHPLSWTQCPPPPPHYNLQITLFSQQEERTQHFFRLQTNYIYPVQRRHLFQWIIMPNHTIRRIFYFYKCPLFSRHPQE